MKKILVADDHKLVLRFMADLLSKEGYKVLIAKDGLSALDILQTETPDVMFVDLIMPNISGDKLCQVIRRIPRFKDLYLVVLSGVAAEHEANLAELGADVCIAKGPLDKMGEQVLAVLNQLEHKGSRGLNGEIQCIGLEDIRRRHPTKELLAIRKHFEVILGGMTEGILELKHGRIVYANPSAVSLTGIAEEKLLGSNFIELFYDGDRRRIGELLGAGTRAIIEKSPDNSPLILNGRHVLLSVLPLEDESHEPQRGELQSLVIVINDITETRRLEARLRQVHKMEAIGTLAGGIAHAFNNLLMGIQGNVSVMFIDHSHSHHERLKKIENQIQSGAKLTSRLLGYARMGKYEARPLDLNHLVEEISSAFGRSRKKITIHRHLADDLYAIEGDHGQMGQVLLSLFVNAEEAMPEGGALTLKTMNTTHESMKAELYDPEPGNYALLKVSDTGVGMDEGILERIFDPFFTTKEMGRDTGLSLPSVYGIIKGHNGYIEVESAKGQGTAVSVYLPASEKKVREVVRTEESFTRGTETVFLIDDEDIVLQVGREMLEAMGYSVLLAKNENEIIEVFRKNRDDIDIVLLDIVIPNVDIGEVYDHMKEINQDVKILLSSGLGIEGKATEMLKRGCNGFIQKPFSMKDLSEKIRKILDQKQA